MKLEVKIDSSLSEPVITVAAPEMTEELGELIRRISSPGMRTLAGFRDESVTPLEQEEIIRLYAAGGKVYAVTEKGEYTVRSRLYELEERMDGSMFVRISNSEIVNIKKARSFDLSLTGTICVRLSDGSSSYVSRRYVSKIKTVLGI